MRLKVIPIKTTVDDIDKLVSYLRTTFGWVALSKVKSTLDSKTTDNRKLEAAKYIGMVNRDGQNIEITDQGRAYASAQDPTERAAIMAKQLSTVELYSETLSWMYHANKTMPTKTDVSEQWHKHHTALLGGAAGAALGDGVLFFMRLAEAAGLGKFITAGKNRPETYFKGDRTAIEAFAATYLTGDTPAEDGEAPELAEADTPTTQVAPSIPMAPHASAASAPPATPNVTLQTSPAVHINIEIHIAADATAETVAEIFKNMRKYVLSNPDEAPEDAE
jgi:hypothetical protein